MSALFDAIMDTDSLNESTRDLFISLTDGDSSIINYAYLFEQFLDMNDIYMYDGWDINEVNVVELPVVKKFYVSMTFAIDKKHDKKSIRKLENCIEQGEVIVKNVEDKTHVTVLIMRNKLDEIEEQNQTKIQNMVDE